MDLASLWDKKILMVSGKGGIGKTLVATALGIAAAESGKKVCIVESNIEDQVGPLLGVPQVGHSLTFARPNLAVINLDANKNFRDFVVMHLGFAKVFEQIFTKPLVQSFVRMIPGIAEVTLLGRLFFHAALDKANNFDLVIFDGFASGHFKSLLSTPDAILNSGFVGPIINETQRVRDYIVNPQLTNTVIVATPEPLVLSETHEFISHIKNQGLSTVGGLIINRFCDYRPQQSLPDSLSPVASYLEQKSNRSSQLTQEFLTSLPPELAATAMTVPEKFHIPEPLSAAWVTSWWNQASKGNQ